MTKTSRSKLPEQHKETNNLKSVYNAIRNGVQEGSTDNRQILQAVHRILEKYRTCEETTQDRRDDKLVNFIMDEFESLLKPYVDNFYKTVELEDLVEEALSDEKILEKIDPKIKTVIKKVLNASIKKLQVKTQTETTRTVTQELDEKSLQKQFQKNLDDIFDDIRKSKNPELEKYRKHISELDKKHTKDITDAYKNSCKKLFEKLQKGRQKGVKPTKSGKNFGVGVKGDGQPGKKTDNLVNNTISNGTSGLIGKLETQEIRKRQKNILEKKFKPYKVSEKKKNYFSFLNEAFSRLKKRISGIFSPMFDSIKKIGGFVLKPFALVLKWTILPLANVVLKIGGALFKGIGLLGKGLFKTLKFFRVDKLVKGVYHMFLDIGKMVGKAVKNTLVAFLMTPAGAYAAGFVLGFLWKKITGGQGGKGIVDLVKKIKNNVIGFVEPAFRAVTNMFFKIFDAYVKPVINFFKPIAKTSVGILQWLFDNKPLVSTILALCPVIEQILSIVGPCRKVFKAAGSPLAGLIAAGIIAVYYGLKGIFAWYKDEDFRLAKGKGVTLHKIADPSQIAIKGMSQDDQKNYGDLTKKIGTESTELDQLTRDIEALKDEYKDDETTTLDLSRQYPEFVESVFDSDLFGNDKTELRKFKKFSRKRRVSDQLRELVKYVNKRYDKLILVKTGLSQSKTSAELKNMIGKIANFDNGKITVRQEVHDIASQIRSDALAVREKSIMNLWSPDEKRAPMTAQFYADKLAGKKFTYKASGQYHVTGPGPGAYIPGHVATEQEYVNNISNGAYQRIEVGGAESRAGDVDDILKGYKGTERSLSILKNHLLSNADEIDKMKRMNSQQRNQAILDILKKWSEQNEKTEEQRIKEDEERTRKMIEDLENDTKEWIERNKLLQDKIDQMIKEQS